MGKDNDKQIVELSIIIVNYNSGKFLEKTIDSIVSQVVNFVYEIIIVDNDSSDNSLSFEMFNIPISIYKLDKNVGFSKANNYGAKRAVGNYFYFLNPDAFIQDKNTILLLKDFKLNDSLGISAPEVLNIDQSLQYNARKYPTIKRLFNYTFGISKIIRTPNICDYKMEFDDHSCDLYPDWVSGAAFVISRQVFNKIGGFDEKFFLFYEDIDLCKRVRELGFEIKYNPSVKVKHIIGGSSTSIKEFTEIEDLKSRFLYFTKHASKRYLLCVKCVTLVNIILRILVFGFFGKFHISITYIKILNVFGKKNKQFI